MNLVELVNLFALASTLFMTVLFLNLILQQLVKSSIRAFFFKLGVFSLFCTLVLVSPYLYENIQWLGTIAPTASIIIYCCWWFSLSILLNEFLNFFIWDRFLHHKGITASKLLRDLIALILFVVTVACIFHFVFDRSVVGLFTASGVMAIILGYSAQTTLGEAFAGIGLNITKQFDIGDWISLSDKTYGKVIDINWRFVNLLTTDDNYLSIPNSQIVKAEITNYSLPNPMRCLTIKVPVVSDIPPEIIKKLLKAATIQCTKVAKSPEPVVYLNEYQVLNYQVYNFYHLSFYTVEAYKKALTDEILSVFWYQYQRAVQTLKNHSLERCSQEEIGDFLQQLDLFSSLNPDEIKLLSEKTTQTIYGPPERILAQGQSNTSLFLIYKGKVDIYIKTPDNTEIKVASLDKGAYFGEMSLLTGDPAGATIVVSTETLLLEINHLVMGTLFASRPELVEKISAIVVQRKLHNDNVTESLKKDISKETHSLIEQLADRVKNFFRKLPKS